MGVDLQGATAVIDADAWPKRLNRELRRLAEEEGITEFVICPLWTIEMSGNGSALNGCP